MPLTSAEIRNAKPQAKPYKLSDGQGLYLLVNPAGGKWWRLRYRFAGKEQMISLGTYPQVSLKEARSKRDEAHAMLAQGINPSEQRTAIKNAHESASANSFEVIAREWHASRAPSWAASHADKIIRRLELDIFPRVGRRPISEITAPELLSALRLIEKRGALDTAHRAQQTCGQIFRYAIATGRAERDITADLRGALPPAKGSHFAAVTDPAHVGELLRMLENYHGTPAVCAALQLAPLVFARPGELRHAEWADIDLEAAEWRFVASKTQTDHIVPLSTQALAILQELHPLTQRSRYVFPSARSGERPMSNNAVLGAMRRLGIPKDEMSGHGFRAMARTILDEVLGFRPDFIEQQLAHAVRDPLGRAYNRTSHLKARKQMMQAWADYLDELKQGKDSNVIPLRSAG